MQRQLGAENEGAVFIDAAQREAVHGEHADKRLLLTRRTLTNDPAAALRAIYDFIGEAPFQHDFSDVDYDAAEFDARPERTASAASSSPGRAQERAAARPVRAARSRQLLARPGQGAGGAAHRVSADLGRPARTRPDFDRRCSASP